MRTIEHGHAVQSRGDLGSATWWGICWLLLALSGCSSGTIEPLPSFPEHHSLGWVITDGGRGPDAAAPICDAGRCACPNDLTDCDGTCVDVTSEAHCGSCGDACAGGATCSDGQCRCPDGLTRCGDACVELTADPQNCQSCGAQCGAGELCTPAGCKRAASCGNLVACGGACVDTQTSLAHCGGCESACGAGQTCSGGTCTCDAGTSACAGTCVDTLSDAHNCGGCGIACGADQTCVQGACTCAGPEVSFADDVAPILERSCGSPGCHGNTSTRAQLNLTLDKSYAELVGVTTVQCRDGRLLVKPGHAADSYLMQKMLGTNMCSGTLMPKAASALPAAELEIIASWICRGAQH